MILNRYNYEEYFLLYVDNELGAEERKAVEAFVSGHPDLAEELKLLQQSVIRPEKHLVFTSKEVLMKSSLDKGLINEGNYEEYFILYADDELSTPEKMAVEAYVYDHPEKQHEFELFRQVKLEPEKLICSFKDTLYKKEEIRKTVPLRWSMTAAAAAAVILIAGWFWLNQGAAIPEQRIADDTPAPKIESNTAGDKKPVADPEQNLAANTEGKDGHTTKAATAAVTPVEKTASSTHTAAAVATRGKQRATSNEKTLLTQDATDTGKKLKPVVNPPQPDVELERPVDIAIAKVKQPEAVTVTTASLPDDVVVHNDNVISFASGDRPENVFLTNIPVDNNVPLRSFLRKASRVINKVTALKHSNSTLR